MTLSIFSSVNCSLC